MPNLDALMFTSCYVLILLVVSHFYYFFGYRKGIAETLLNLKRFEPEAVDKALKKINIENGSND